MKKALIGVITMLILLAAPGRVQAQAVSMCLPNINNCSVLGINFNPCQVGPDIVCCTTTAACVDRQANYAAQQAQNLPNQEEKNEGVAEANMLKLCKFTDGTMTAKCTACIQGSNGTKIWTAIGCIDASPNNVVQSLLSIAIGIAGGIAFLLILFGGFIIMTSAGNPDRLNSGRELITAAISGLILIIFSLFIMQLVGFRILRIPGFG